MLWRHLLIACAAGPILLGCASAQEPQQMYEKASAFTKLTSHVDAAVIYGPTGRSESDQALFDKAFEDNPTLKPLLASHTILLQRGERGVVLMLCTPDGARGLLEDLSCTPDMDRHYWRDEPYRSCSFVLSAASCQ